jgi:type II secretory pathway component PulJ
MLNNAVQRGFTLIGLMMMFAVIGFFALIVMRLLPVYMEDNAISGAVVSVAAEMPATASILEARKAFGKRLEINNVKAVVPNDLTLGGEGGIRTLVIEYEGRAPFINNISFVVDFYHEAALGGAATP